MPDIGSHSCVGGNSCQPPGTSQALHRDFRLHPDNGLFHRVNVLVYLNSDWKEEYGGMLELWSTGKKAFGQQVEPVAGRLVLFETTPFAYHGVPDPVRFPPGRARISTRLLLLHRLSGTYGSKGLHLLLPQATPRSLVFQLPTPKGQPVQHLVFDAGLFPESLPIASSRYSLFVLKRRRDVAVAGEGHSCTRRRRPLWREGLTGACRGFTCFEHDWLRVFSTTMV